VRSDLAARAVSLQEDRTGHRAFASWPLPGARSGFFGQSLDLERAARRELAFTAR